MATRGLSHTEELIAEQKRAAWAHQGPAPTALPAGFAAGFAAPCRAVWFWFRNGRFEAGRFVLRFVLAAALVTYLTVSFSAMVRSPDAVGQQTAVLFAIAAIIAAPTGVRVWRRWDDTANGPRASAALGAWLGAIPVALFAAAIIVATILTAGVALFAVFVLHKVFAGTDANPVGGRGAPTQRGEVLWAEVPFSNGERDESGRDRKVRPVVVVGDSARGLRVMQMTSKVDKHRDDRRYVPVQGSWDAKGRPSVVDTTRELVISRGQVERRAGALGDSDLNRVEGQAQRSGSRPAEDRTC